MAKDIVTFFINTEEATVLLSYDTVDATVPLFIGTANSTFVFFTSTGQATVSFINETVEVNVWFIIGTAIAAFQFLIRTTDEAVFIPLLQGKPLCSLNNYIISRCLWSRLHDKAMDLLLVIWERHCVLHCCCGKSYFFLRVTSSHEMFVNHAYCILRECKEMHLYMIHSMCILCGSRNTFIVNLQGKRILSRDRLI